MATLKLLVRQEGALGHGVDCGCHSSSLGHFHSIIAEGQAERYMWMKRSPFCSQLCVHVSRTWLRGREDVGFWRGLWHFSILRWGHHAGWYAAISCEVWEWGGRKTYSPIKQAYPAFFLSSVFADKIIRHNRNLCCVYPGVSVTSFSYAQITNLVWAC